MAITRPEWLTAPAFLGIASPASAIEPIPRNGRASFELGLAAYSFRQTLDLKKKAMTLEGFFDQAPTWPLDAVRQPRLALYPCVV